jgi:hypothetical protein
LECSLTNAYYVVFGLAEAIMAKTNMLKTCYRSKPFQQDQLYEEWSLGTGVMRGRKTANNIDDSSIGFRSKI